MTGCQFVEHDDFRDYRQVVAAIAPVKDPLFENGSSGTRYIYKYDLRAALSQQAQSGGTSFTQTDKTNVLKELVKRELLYIELEREYLRGNIVWRDGTQKQTDDYGREYYDYTDINAVKKAKYESIDQTLSTIQKTVLQERNGVISDDGGETDGGETATQYPVREQELSDEIVPEEEEWMPDETHIPTKYTVDPDRLSLEKQSLERFAAQIINTVKDGFKVYDSKKLDDAEKAFKDLMRAGDYEGLYLSFGDSYPIEFLAGENIERQTRLDAYRQKLTKEIAVSKNDVAARYQVMLNSQQQRFASGSAYSTAVSASTPSSDKEMILYRPNSDYFYVRHILVPFSTAQQDLLKTYRAAGSGKTKTEVDLFRDTTLYNNITAYPHPDGNNVIEAGTTAKAVLEEVVAAVRSAGSDVAQANRIFTDKLYLYNTDTGSFADMNGYAVNKTFDPDNRAYMEEFEIAAEDLLKNHKPGDILDYPVITDFGMHIMFYASDTSAGAVKDLYDYETFENEKTVYEVIEKQLRSAMESGVFTNWQDSSVNALFQKTGAYELFEKRYETISF
jgi:hypothetical protein